MSEVTGLQRLLSVLDLAPHPPERPAELPPAPGRPAEVLFVGDSVPTPFGGRIYGGQVLAQALLACGRTVDPDRLPHSMHAYFLREGKKKLPIEFAVENLRDGGSFSSRRTLALQSGKAILAATASFQLDQPGYDAQIPMPRDVPPPETLVSARELVKDYDIPSLQWWGRDSAFDIVPVSPSILLGPDPAPSSRQMVWVRSRAPIGPPPDASVSEQLWHRALLAFVCDQFLLEPAVRGAGKSWADVVSGIPMASLDHAMWWHRDFRFDEWLLFVQEAGTASGGRTLGQARVYTRNGALAASIAQEGLMRMPAA